MDGGVDELGHIEHDQAGFTTDGGGAFSHSAEEEGHKEGEDGGIDSLHEGGGTELVHGVLSFLRLGNAADQVGDERLNLHRGK